MTKLTEFKRILRLSFLLMAGPLFTQPSYAQQPEASINDRLTAIENVVRNLERRLEAIEGNHDAQSQPSPALGEQIAAIEERIATAERRQEGTGPAASAPIKASAVVGASNEGFVIRSADGAFAFNLRGSLQADSRLFPSGSPQPGASTLTITKVRPTFEGTVYRNFSFKMMPEFGSGISTLLDGYLDATIRPWLKLRAGKFKGPVGLERLVADADVEFYERFLPTNLVPNRDVGVQFSGDFGGGLASYAAGIFNGTADGTSTDLDSDNQREFEGRVFFHPFRKTTLTSLQGLGIGMGGSVGRKHGTFSTPQVAPYRTTAQVNFFRYRSDGNASGTVMADGTHSRLTPQAYFYWGRLGAWGEYVISSQQLRRGTDLATIDNSAWQFGATYVLTGEKASYRAVIPAHDLSLSNGTWGALEVGARYGHLTVDRSAFPLFADPLGAAGGAQSWTLGVNWYANRNVKFVLNFEQTNFQTVSGGVKRKQENAILERFQIAF